MSTGVEPRPVIWLCSCLSSKEMSLEHALSLLEELLGPMVLKSEQFPFELSRYYEIEMGRDLSRTWLCFGRLDGAEQLPRVKMAVAELERRLARNGSRSINLDPGYLDFGKLVLASFKEAPDKIYMGNGVWAHTCLQYRNGFFEAPDHSFPDFRDGRFNGFFTNVRELYRQALRKIQS